MSPQQRYNLRNKAKVKREHRLWTLRNIDHVKAYAKAYRQKHLKRINDVVRDYTFKRLYGITLTQYRELLKKQNNRCALCHNPEVKFKKRLSVDHNHKTGQVRALLCLGCNTKLAIIENVQFVSLAKKYLREYDNVQTKRRAR